MFNLRLFLLNHSAVYAWHNLPVEVREHCPQPNPMLLHAECFVADQKRREYCFELLEAVKGEAEPVRHRADVVIMQSWGLTNLARYGARAGRAARFTGLSDTVIVSAAYVGRRWKP